MSLENMYNPRDIETRWYENWEKNGYFSPNSEKSHLPTYCIMIPPPNITGSLHMGHAFQDTIMDLLIRYHRMMGYQTLWQPGMDHAGIATQMVVEKLMEVNGKNSNDYSREKFIQRIWEWKCHSGGMIKKQLKRMGASLDWKNERFTMDEGFRDAVNEVFVQLYDAGIIYRGKRLVNWDPVLHTALSDLEVVSEEEHGYLWYIRYPFINRIGSITVATTRPETMFGDSAIAVHPNDTRYKHLIGQYVKSPLTKRKIPIIIDEYVDLKFGSGCVKITPAHDFNDYKVWTRHCQKHAMLEQPYGGLINIFNDSAMIRKNKNNEKTLNVDIIPTRYVGLDRFEARKKIVKDLKTQQLIDKIEKHTLVIPRSERSNTVVEPYLTDQWYVDLTRDVQDDGRPGGKAVIIDPSIKVLKTGQIRFIPKHWTKIYYQWLENVEDWCISRQICWGHRIPAWYDHENRIYVGKSEDIVRKKYKLSVNLALKQDEDVLDTWFSSALWPFSSLGWPKTTDRLKTFYPTSVLVTGFDIIFFWVARMIMMGTTFTDDLPFKEVYVHGLVRDVHGEKMSKSKGNVLDPIDIIDGIDLESLVKKRTHGMMKPRLSEKIAKQTRRDFPHGIPSFGADALRFTFTAMASNGRDINFDLGRISGYRNFCNKIWNAARFVLRQCETRGLSQEIKEYELSLPDRWIISTLQRTIKQVEYHIKSYRFDLLAKEIYEFIWNDYCSWYLELCKSALNSERISNKKKDGARKTLLGVLESSMRMIHPVMPFISEEIWRQISVYVGWCQGKSIMKEPYPDPKMEQIDHLAEKQMEWLMEVIRCIRQIKGELHISSAKKVVVFVADLNQEQKLILNQNLDAMIFLSKAKSILVVNYRDAPESVIKLAKGAKILIPLVDLIDKNTEFLRLKNECCDIKLKIQWMKNKLMNEQFITHAPKHIIEDERMKLSKAKLNLIALEKQIHKINNL